MNNLLASIATWPAVAIYTLIGAIAGIIGALVALPLTKTGITWARYVPIIFVAISVVVLPRHLTPVLDHAYLNQGLPKKLDERTTLLSATMTGRTLTYAYELEGELPEDFHVSEIKDGSLAGMCSTFAEHLRTGTYRSVVYSYSTSLGPQQFELTPADCP